MQRINIQVYFSTIRSPPNRPYHLAAIGLRE